MVLTRVPEPKRAACGILAFGSLIWEPRELETLNKVGEVICMTPWPVEFARSSRSRHWAPTLVRFDQGTAVRARVFLYANDPETVRGTLARREGIDLRTHPNTIQQCEIEGVRVNPVWYTALGANIDDLRPACLARLAIASVKPCPERNGIRYLHMCVGLGISTALTAAYAAEVLRVSRCDSLEEAEQWAAK